MSKRNRRNALRLGTQATDLMFAVPHVMSHRLARLGAKNAGSSRRDQREFARMSAEKFAALGESWTAMALQMMKANQQLASAWMFAPWPLSRAAAQMQSIALQTLVSGVAPVHKRAVANSRRLRRVKIR
ncbi:MAG: polyhydroxyalkanoate granule-associated phasin [Burkholderiaceae bacterium]